MVRAGTTHSLAVRLAVLAAAGSLISLAVAGTVMALLQRAGAERAFDERLSDFITPLFAAYANGELTDAAPLLANPGFAQVGSGWLWSVGAPQDADPLFASASLFDPLPPFDRSLPASAAGLVSRSVQYGDQRIRLQERVFRFEGEDVLVRVSAPTAGLDAEIQRFQAWLLVTLSAMWVVFLALSAAQVRIGLNPLRQLKQAVADVRDRRNDRVDGAFPTEVSPLVDELNAMMTENAEVIERSRHYVGNLAHALKTPLAVILNASASQPAIHAEAKAIEDRVRLYLDRAQRAALQSVAGQASDLNTVMEPLVRTMLKLNRDAGISIETRIPAGARVRVESHDLEEMLGNLLENACRFARSSIQISGTESGSVTTINIDDDGPGLTEDERQRVLSRGQRLDQSVPGSGLGLAIVTETASLYQGSFQLSSAPSGGLRATLNLPSAAPVPPESSLTRSMAR